MLGTKVRRRPAFRPRLTCGARGILAEGRLAAFHTSLTWLLAVTFYLGDVGEPNKSSTQNATRRCIVGVKSGVKSKEKEEM